MILSASRRTDIPAYFSEWLLERLRAGWVPVKNPRNPHQVRRVELTPDLVDCIVFWTKNPAPLIPHLDEIDTLGYRYAFLFTLNDYGSEMEPGVPALAERIKTFQYLANRIGRLRMVWRYDPVIFTPELSLDHHIQGFEQLLVAIGDCCCKCIVSFVDFYNCCRGTLARLGAFDPPDAMKCEMITRFATIAKRVGIPIETCAEPLNLAGTGARPGHCIDSEWLEAICNRPLKLRHASGQRQLCGCAESFDIGSYGTCRSGCVYCYATRKRS